MLSKTYSSILAGVAAALVSVAAHAAGPIHPFEPDSMQRIVAAEQGKPFVVVMWSLDCEFCRASLNTLSKARHQNKDLDIVTISTDQVDDPELAPMMRERLAKLGLDRDAWAFSGVPPERLRYAIDRSWHGEKPRSYWFNAKGERVAYSGVITPAVIDKFMKR
jgi:thiol-disulfide isomerase/thioredoxin